LLDLVVFYIYTAGTQIWSAVLILPVASETRCLWRIPSQGSHAIAACFSTCY